MWPRARQRGDERRAVGPGEGEQRWAHISPSLIAVGFGQQILLGGDRPVSLEHEPLRDHRGVEGGGGGVVAGPMTIDHLDDGGGVAVGGRRDTPGTTLVEGVEKAELGPGVDGETGDLEKAQGVGPIARRVLDRDDLPGEGPVELGDQLRGEADPRDLGDVVQHDPGIVVDRVDEAAEVVMDPGVGRCLHEERGENHGGPTPEPQRMGRELDRVGEVGEAGARLKSPRIDAAVDRGLERGASLVDAEAEGLAGGAERSEPDAALFEEPMGVPDIKVGGHR